MHIFEILLMFDIAALTPIKERYILFNTRCTTIAGKPRPFNHTQYLIISPNISVDDTHGITSAYHVLIRPQSWIQYQIRKNYGYNCVNSLDINEEVNEL